MYVTNTQHNKHNAGVTDFDFTLRVLRFRTWEQTTPTTADKDAQHRKNKRSANTRPRKGDQAVLTHQRWYCMELLEMRDCKCLPTLHTPCLGVRGCCPADDAHAHTCCTHYAPLQPTLATFASRSPLATASVRYAPFFFVFGSVVMVENHLPGLRSPLPLYQWLTTPSVAWSTS